MPSSLAFLCSLELLRAAVAAWRRGALVLGALLVIASGCARDARFELLALAPLEVTRLDAGRAIVLAGRGFPVGREVDVSFRGVSFGPLGVRRRVAHTLRARAVSPEAVELTASDADVEGIGGRGTFVGSLEIVVSGASLPDLEARVVGVLDDVRLDVVPSERARARARRGTRAGIELAPLFGLELGDERDPATDDDDELSRGADDDRALGAEGAAITAVEPDGAAAREGLVARGLAPGTRIVAIDGMTVLGADDLRVDARAPRVALELELASGARVPLTVNLDSVHGRTPDRTTRYDQLAVLVLVFAILFGAWPRATRGRTARPAQDDKPLAAILTSSLALLATLTLSTLAPDAWWSGTIPAWLAAAIFLRAASALAAETSLRELPPRDRDAGTRRGRVGRAIAALRLDPFVAIAAALAVSAAIGAFLAARGSAESASLPSFGGPLASAPWMPMSWPLVRAPFGPFALMTLLASAAMTSPAIAAPATRFERVLRGVDDLGLAALASVFARVAIADPAALDASTRASALLATVAIFVGLLRTRSAARGAERLVSLAGVGLAAVTVAVAFAWLSRPDDASLLAGEQAVAEVVLACVGLIVVRVASLPGAPAGGPAAAPPPARQIAREFP